MENFYTELKNYMVNGVYHSLTTTSANPESRKAAIRKASKKYLVKGDDLYYKFQDKRRLVVCSKDRARDVLKECHDHLGDGVHPGRRRTVERVLASYHWSTLREDVNKWVDECPRCQRNETVKTAAPVLHPIHVSEAWSVLGVDLIGPLPTTAKDKRFILTATELFIKWVVAKSLYTKTATEASRIIVYILLAFGNLQRRIHLQVNRGVFEANCNPGSVKRSWEQIKNKHKNVNKTANRKKHEARKTGAGPPPQDHTPAEELALSNNQGHPLMERGLSSDPDGTGSSQQGTFVHLGGETLLLLPPPTYIPLSHTEVEALDDQETVSICSERALVVGDQSDNVRSLYKRTLELEIEYKTILIKKVMLEVDKLEYEKKERENKKLFKNKDL